MKIWNEIVSDLTQAHRDTFESQETDHKILANCISYRTYFSIQLQVFWKSSYSLLSQSVILLHVALYIRHNKNSNIRGQNTHFYPAIKLNSHYKIAIRFFKVISENLEIHQHIYSVVMFFILTTLPLHKALKIGIFALLGPLNQICILQFKLTWRDQKIEKQSFNHSPKRDYRKKLFNNCSSSWSQQG